MTDCKPAMGRPRLPAPTEKTCPHCKQTKPVSEFYPKGPNYPNRYQSYCRPCMKERQRFGGENRRKTLWLHRYGLTLADFERLLNEQQHRCAICRQDPGATMHVDHCHETNRVRGLLCGNCNRALGQFKDNVVNLSNAIAYLLKGGQ